MNWETAKGWLIAAFLVLDLVLGFQVIQSRNELQGYVESYSDLLANTKTLLADHGFTLAASIPQDEPNLPSFQAQFSNPELDNLWPVCFPKAKTTKLNFNDGSVVTEDGRIKFISPGTWQVMYTNPAPIGSVVSPLHYVWQGNAYQLDSPTSAGGGTQTYTQLYDSLPIFDVTVNLDVESGSLYGFIQTSIQGIAPAGKPQPIISALDALDNLANSVDKTGDGVDNKISRVDLGYAHKISVAPSQSGTVRDNYWFPVWRVLTDRQIYYVNALTGEVEVAP
jgi:regulatory protein YycI of two-component signal transduction system YycFG